ncbi:NAD-dependent epimerase/dehydratase family protein [Paramagnetospirillum magneticum]|uniref:Nucleoside-diphosphate-sugar epimerase n=1 Tax=Paramagnetospirillum magneticum (strain ATCC 700264 / AMB-1) TaxID=342108 RepID=Q2W7D4_PARM1|nr:NAD-dependent epimerase/dehydratase family protein [Paramagnetospirillum magneticum]BAE50241.1 Nucleoside-diphosphate-sugar epimerase [Paramagnetospirillum magneticum AMB-1]
MVRHYLVTGGCGFLGSRLVSALLAAGHGVTVLDILAREKASAVPADVRLLAGDVAQPEIVARAMDGVDGCFHLAAVASVEQCNRRWAETHRINQGGCVNVLDAARLAGRERPIPVVLASSAAVYGASGAIPLDEAAPAWPVSPYGADKLGGELHARVSASTFGGRVTALRIFNAFGPGQVPDSPYSGVISIFIDRAMKGEDLVIFGDGAQIRDFVFVDDVVRGFRRAMGVLESSSEPRAAIYNVCGGMGVEIGHLARTVIDLCQSPSRVVHAPARTGDIRLSVGNPAAAHAELGFVPSSRLEDGLAATIAWAKGLAEAGR